MADDIPLPGTGAIVETKEQGDGSHRQVIDLASLGSGTTPITTALPVTGTFWQATQPVSGTFFQATQPVSGTFFQATQPISGTVTANAGTGPFPVSDNAGSLTVDAPVGTPAFVRLSDGASPITTLPVSGTFFQATQPVSLATAPTTPVTGTFWQATQPVSGTFWQATQPISGTVTVNALPGGTNNIGDVDVLTQPARAATTDNIGAKLCTDAIMDGSTALTPKFAIIDAAGSGDNTLVAAVNPKKLRVLSLFLVAAGTVNVRFESGAGGTAKSGQMNLVANTGFVLPFNPVGWFETASNTLLNLELSAAVSVDGGLVYVEV